MTITKETQWLMIIKDRNIMALSIGVIIVLVGLMSIFSPQVFKEKPSLSMGIIFSLLGSFVIFKTKVTTVILDKNTNKLTFTHKSLLSRKAKEYSLNQIKAVELQQIYERKGYSYGLVFILENNEVVSLTSMGGRMIRSNIGIGRKTIKESLIGTRIASFLNVPFNERRAPTLTEIISATKKTIQEEIEKRKKDESQK